MSIFLSRKKINPKISLNGILLEKQLASEAQLSGGGEVSAGTGTNTRFRKAEVMAQEYGGKAEDWIKMKSSVHTTKDGTSFRLHWVENSKTNQKIVMKTKLKETS